MNNQTKNNSSSLPIIIIGLVLLAAIAGFLYLYQSSKATPKTPTANANKKSDVDFQKVYANAPAGAPLTTNILGSPTAAVTVEEFADYQCPTCAATHPKMKELNSIYGSRIKFIYRNYPLPMHKHGYEASVAAEAAGLQGKFWEMQNQLFTNQQSWANAADARTIFAEYAQKIGLDVDKFQTDSLGLAAKNRVDSDLQRGRALGVSGTPTIYINGRELTQQQFDVSAMRQAIDAELQKAQGGGAQTNAPTNQTTTQSSPSTNGAGNANAGEAKKDTGGNTSEKK